MVGVFPCIPITGCLASVLCPLKAPGVVFPEGPRCCVLQRSRREPKVFVSSPQCCWEMVAPAGAPERKLHPWDMTFVGERGRGPCSFLVLVLLHEISCLTEPLSPRATSLRPQSNTAKKPESEISKARRQISFSSTEGDDWHLVLFENLSVWITAISSQIHQNSTS